MNSLNKTDPKRYPSAKLEVLNPKSITMNELFGWVDYQTTEWNDGVLSSMMSRLCKDESILSITIYHSNYINNFYFLLYLLYKMLFFFLSLLLPLQ